LSSKRTLVFCPEDSARNVCHWFNGRISTDCRSPREDESTVENTSGDGRRRAEGRVVQQRQTLTNRTLDLTGSSPHCPAPHFAGWRRL
jgi:hypothetical protein